MGNLIQPHSEYFFGTLTAKQIGLYTGTAAGAGNTYDYLALKTYGVNIPYISSAVSSYTYELPHIGAKKCVWLTFSNTFIPEMTKGYETYNSYEYGIEIEQKVQYPGVFYQEAPLPKWYGSTMDITPSSGLIPDASLEKQEREIIRQIHKDTNDGSGVGGAIVDARRVYQLTYVNAGGTDRNGFTVTWYDNSTGLATGVTYVFLESAATYTIGHVIDEFNADANVNTKLEAYLGADATTYYIRSKGEGQLFTLGTAVQSTINLRFVELRAKSAAVSFIPKFKEAYATVEDHFELTFDTTGIGATTGKITLRYKISGTVTASDCSQASAANVTSTINGYTGLSATLIGATVSVWGDRTTCEALDFDLVFNAARTTVIGSGTVLDTPDLMGTTRYPRLTSADVARTFANKGNAGNLSNLLQIDLPAKDVDYIKYTFKTIMPNHYDNVVAGGLISQEVKFDIYFPLAVLTTAANLWTSTNFMLESGDTGFAADRTWIQLLTAWAT